MPRRFVIHLHTTGGGSHYDLMLETGPTLATWRLPWPPTALAGPHASILAYVLPDHRPAYLTYQGPVSRGRGTVRIFDRGSVRLIARSESSWLFDLRGRRVSGTFMLRRLDSQRWRLLSTHGGSATRGG